MNSLPSTVTRQRLGCDLNPGPTAPESSMLTTRLPSHPQKLDKFCNIPPRSQFVGNVQMKHSSTVSEIDNFLTVSLD